MIGAVALEIALTIILSLLLSGLFTMLLGAPPLDAFFREGPQLLILGMGVGFVVWIVLLIIGMVRNRNRAGGWRVGTSVVSAIVAAFINLVVVAVIGFTGGGWSAFIIVFAIEAGFAFLIASIAAALIVHLKVFKRKPEPEVASAP
jgi:hypothetical protein